MSNDAVYPDDLRTYKGRDRSAPARGENARSSKLTKQQVIEIKRRLRDVAEKRETVAGIARDFGVGQTTVAKIRDGATWTHVRID